MRQTINPFLTYPSANPSIASVAALSLALFTSVAVAATPRPLNDTGITTCINDSGTVACTTVAPDNGTHPRQDARFGRDAANAAGALTKVGGGGAGFDFTKIANNGTVLAAGAALGDNATDWACARDNVTGLVWEIKVNNTSHLRHQDHLYTWYSDATRSDGTNAAQNGGSAGTANGGSCFNKYDAATNPTGNYCDSAGYVAAINAANLCNAHDWRMPTAEELRSLVDYAKSGTGLATIDTTYFPNTSLNSFWSGSTFASSGSNGWIVDFLNGSDNFSVIAKSNSYRIRLVRGSQ
jgi:hypothetical protein